MPESSTIRVGHGYDLHRLDLHPPEGVGKAMVIGSVVIEHSRGPVAHSDGDCLLHAVTDALLGALALPDIGEQFPDSDPQWEGADSVFFLRAAVEQVHARGWCVGNLDATVILEQPRLSGHKGVIREAIAALLEISIEDVNIKGKSHEGVDAVGAQEAIEAHVVVVLVRVGEEE